MFSIKTVSGFILMMLIGISCLQQSEYNAAKNEIVFAISDSPYHIKHDIVVDSGKKLVLLPGAEMIFYDSAHIIIHGGIRIKGNKEDPVILRPAVADSLWGGFKILQPDDSCVFEWTHIRNGLIYGEDASVKLSECQIKNNYSLEKFDALVRLFRGSVQIKNSYFESNQTGEGLLIHETGENLTLVENCEFRGVTDAVEYLNVYKNGIIRGNRFYNIQQKYGDGIDLNGCEDILIENNYFENIIDFGIEVGNDKYGPSKDILIRKNIFVDCFKGLVVKGGSDVRVINNTFYKNTFGVECMGEKYGSNYDPNSIEVINSIFSKSISSDHQNNDNSAIQFQSCLSDKQPLPGKGNLFADPLFADAARRNFKLKKDSPCIGKASKMHNNSCADLGAICYKK